MKIVQIEVSSRCNARCVMCPYGHFRDEWLLGDMGLEEYSKTVESLRGCELVWLQGWGEPLLSRNIYEMVRLAKKIGARVGLTTNGMLLDEPCSRRLIREGIDIVTISLAGATREVHEKIRVGTDFNRILENIRTFSRLRRSLGEADIKLVITFLRMKQNIMELPKVVELAGELGVDEVVGTNLDYIPTKEHYEMKVFSQGKPEERYVNVVRASEEKARELGVSMYNYPLEMREVAVCSEDPTSSMYISHDGYVSPCVYLNLPLRSGLIPRYFVDRYCTVPRLIYGNIKTDGIGQILKRIDYVNFREIFERRKRALDWTNVLEKLLEGGQLGNIPHVPEPCQTCYKAYGV